MKNLLGHISACIGQEVLHASPVSGGDINRAYRLETTNGKYFLKTNSSSRFPGMFKAEAHGLELIAQTNTIAVPHVVLHDSVDDDSFLLLEWIDSKSANPINSQQLGRQLAAMHRSTSAQFGLTASNYMGSLTQSNTQCDTWTDFFIAQRLQPMVKMAVDKRRLNANDISAFGKLYKKLPNIFNEEPPALIHGDLWGGNYLIGTNEKPYLIDPALSYGHREFDIAMTTLFGGFSDEFYMAYNEVFALAKGWQQRLDLWNLYPLLVHVNLFGGSYVGQVRSCIAGYV